MYTISFAKHFLVINVSLEISVVRPLVSNCFIVFGTYSGAVEFIFFVNFNFPRESIKSSRFHFCN